MCDNRDRYLERLKIPSLMLNSFFFLFFLLFFLFSLQTGSHGVSALCRSSFFPKMSLEAYQTKYNGRRKGHDRRCKKTYKYRPIPHASTTLYVRTHPHRHYPYSYPGSAFFMLSPNPSYESKPSDPQEPPYQPHVKYSLNKRRNWEVLRHSRSETPIHRIETLD